MKAGDQLVTFNTVSLFIIQLIGIISAGGFIGEFYRTINSSETITPGIFLSRFLAGGFLSFCVAYGVYILSNHKETSLIIGGLLSYQKEQFVKELSKKLLKSWIEKKGGDE